MVVCPSEGLANGQYRKLNIVFEGRADECLHAVGAHEENGEDGIADYRVAVLAA